MSLPLQRHSSVRCRTGDKLCLKRPNCSSTGILRQRQHCNARSRLYSQARERSRTSWLPICRGDITQDTCLTKQATETTSGEDEKVLHTITEYFENAKQLHANGVGAATTRQLQLFHQAEQQMWRARDLLKSHNFPVKSPYQELLQVSYRSSLQDLKTSRRFQEAVLVMLGNYGAAFLTIAGYCCSVCAAVMVTLGLALASVQKLPDFVWRLPLWTFVSCLQFLLVAPHVATMVMGALEGECDRVDAAFPGLDQDESAQSVVVFREAMQLVASNEQQVQEAQRQRLYAAQARKIEAEIHKFAEQLGKHIEQH